MFLHYYILHHIQKFQVQNCYLYIGKWDKIHDIYIKPLENLQVD